MRVNIEGDGVVRKLARKGSRAPVYLYCTRLVYLGALRSLPLVGLLIPVKPALISSFMLGNPWEDCSTACYSHFRPQYRVNCDI